MKQIFEISFTAYFFVIMFSYGRDVTWAWPGMCTLYNATVSEKSLPCTYKISNLKIAPVSFEIWNIMQVGRLNLCLSILRCAYTIAYWFHKSCTKFCLFCKPTMPPILCFCVFAVVYKCSIICLWLSNWLLISPSVIQMFR